MDRHVNFWLTIGSAISVASIIAFMVILTSYCKANGHDTSWSALLIIPLIYSIVQMVLNYFNLTEGK